MKFGFTIIVLLLAAVNGAYGNFWIIYLIFDKISRNFRCFCYIITGDVDKINGVGVKKDNVTVEGCEDSACESCVKKCTKDYGILNPEYPKCMKGCKNGAFSYQANAFVITTLLFMFYLVK